MSSGKQIIIDPVTRIEGHGRVVVNLDAKGEVADAFLTVAEFRGFEKFCEGRMIWEMPTITSRVCGFCPVSHHLASVKACEALLGVEPPPAAVKLRTLLHMGQIIHSHALHFFFCAAPDFITGDATLVPNRSVFGLLQNNPNIAQNAIKLRKAGQDIVDRVGGGRLHPVSCIPGGMTKPFDNFTRVELLRSLLPAIKIAQLGVKMIKDIYAKSPGTFQSFASFPSYYMGLTNEDRLEMYDGPVRMINDSGQHIGDFAAKDYLQHLQETVDDRSWTKSISYIGGKKGNIPYRVASLARLNIAKSIATPLANAELQEYKKIGDGKPLESSLFYHYARMIELLYAAEMAKELLTDPDILSPDVRVPVKRCEGEGVGVLEAPRGTLFHHYWANDTGHITKVNLVVSTAHNCTAMNDSVTSVARSVVKDGKIPEKSLNKVEMAIRCYDPCLSCSSHAHGQMPLEILIHGHDGELLSRYDYGYRA
ncbi:MAG: Ni/Fe hydrogenase subunit alpha [Desulfuromonadales bacterium]|nr:Ni/Fe hydrogenase subunit alpha [Desulfuromonadales bacterium]